MVYALAIAHSQPIAGDDPLRWITRRGGPALRYRFGAGQFAAAETSGDTMSESSAESSAEPDDEQSEEQPEEFTNRAARRAKGKAGSRPEGFGKGGQPTVGRGAAVQSPRQYGNRRSG
jgi:hypothetical protein